MKRYRVTVVVLDFEDDPMPEVLRNVINVVDVNTGLVVVDSGCDITELPDES